MSNKQYIDQYAPEYIQRIEECNGTKGWWSFTAWLASFTFAGSFTMSDIDYAKKAIGVN